MVAAPDVDWIASSAVLLLIVAACLLCFVFIFVVLSCFPVSFQLLFPCFRFSSSLFHCFLTQTVRVSVVLCFHFRRAVLFPGFFPIVLSLFLAFFFIIPLLFDANSPVSVVL